MLSLFKAMAKLREVNPLMMFTFLKEKKKEEGKAEGLPVMSKNKEPEPGNEAPFK